MPLCGRWLLLALLTASAGCTSLQTRGTGPTAAGPKPPVADATVDQLIADWNENSAKIRSFVCQHADIEGSSQGQIYTLNAQVAYQEPDSFRLVGRALGKSQVDLGANGDEIWFWIARAEPPAVYYCKRGDLANLRLGIPFQPDWLKEALGVAPFNASSFREGQGSAEYIALVAKETTPGGLPVTKRLIANRSTRRLAKIELWGPENKLLAEAFMLEYFEDPSTKAYMPRVVKLQWPDADTKLTMRFRASDTTWNQISPDYAADLFQRRPYINTEEIDLARMARRASGPNPRRGVMNDATASAPPPPAPARRDFGSRPAAALTGEVEAAAVPAASAIP